MMTSNRDGFHPKILSEVEETLAQCSLDSTSKLNETHEKILTLQTPLSLLNLPREIRECIYGYIFNTLIKNVSVPRPEQRRGNGLSLACSQLYSETRIRYYNRARYHFSSPGECRSFFDKVGSISHHIGSLVIDLKDDIMELAVLKDVFNILLKVSELHTLKLKIRPSRPPMSSLSLPMYFPAARLSDPATYYDMCLRPPNHPLAKNKSIRNLKVAGYAENCELEEAILKLSLNMEETAVRERRQITSCGSGASWCYSMKIAD